MEGLRGFPHPFLFYTVWIAIISTKSLTSSLIPFYTDKKITTLSGTGVFFADISVQDKEILEAFIEKNT